MSNFNLYLFRKNLINLKILTGFMLVVFYAKAQQQQSCLTESIRIFTLMPDPSEAININNNHYGVSFNRSFYSFGQIELSMSPDMGGVDGINDFVCHQDNMDMIYFSNDHILYKTTAEQDESGFSRGIGENGLPITKIGLDFQALTQPDCSRYNINPSKYNIASNNSKFYRPNITTFYDIFYAPTSNDGFIKLMNDKNPLPVKIDIKLKNGMTFNNIQQIILPGDIILEKEDLEPKAIYESAYLASSAYDDDFIYGLDKFPHPEDSEPNELLDPTAHTNTEYINGNVIHPIRDPSKLNYDWTNYKFHKFQASFETQNANASCKNVDFFVSNRSWPLMEDAAKVAVKYAEALGRIPEVLRDFSKYGANNKFEVIVVNKLQFNDRHTHEFTSNTEFIPGTHTVQILIDDFFVYTRQHVWRNEEAFMHECSHVLFDNHTNGYNASWLEAVQRDHPWFISDYALDKHCSNNPEDHSETFPIWLLYKFKKDRVKDPIGLNDKLKNRFEYYEEHFNKGASNHISIYPWSLPNSVTRKNTLKKEALTVTKLDLEAVEIKNIDNLHIYPNPSKGVFTLEFLLKTTNLVSCVIFDVNGRQVLNYKKQLEAGNNTININVSNRSANIYFLKITGEGFSEERRLIIEK